MLWITRKAEHSWDGRDTNKLCKRIESVTAEEQTWIIEQLDGDPWEDETPPWDSAEDFELHFEWKLVDGDGRAQPLALLRERRRWGRRFSNKWPTW